MPTIKRTFPHLKNDRKAIYYLIRLFNERFSRPVDLSNLRIKGGKSK